MDRLTIKKGNDYITVKELGTIVNPIVLGHLRLTKLGALEDLMDKYSIPDINYLEKCIVAHDKYGEEKEKMFDAYSSGIQRRLRLTPRKDVRDKIVFSDDWQTNEICKRQCDIEDIEEELGINLITLFKALKNGVYYFENSKIKKWAIDNSNEFICPNFENEQIDLMYASPYECSCYVEKPLYLNSKTVEYL